jgi:hypothetical protein
MVPLLFHPHQKWLRPNKQSMYKALFAGVIVGGLVGVILARREKRRQHTLGRRRTDMPAEDEIFAAAQALSAERPETATPSQDFIRDWAYGNAGLEDESITVEQVERVLGARST